MSHWYLKHTIFTPCDCSGFSIELIKSNCRQVLLKFSQNIHKFQQLQHFGLDVSILLIALLVSSANPFLYCYHGKMTTDYYAKMADCLFEANWQVLPVDLQRYFILMIQHSQKPVYYRGFGMANLDLETFRDVRTCCQKLYHCLY